MPATTIAPDDRSALTVEGRHHRRRIAAASARPRATRLRGWWLGYCGCEDCCRGEWHPIECGGLFEHIRVFVGGVDIANTKGPQIPPAGRALKRDEDGDEDDEDGEPE